MSDVTEGTKPVAKPKKPRAGRKVKAKVAKVAKAPAVESVPYPGMTVTDCCKACGIDGCAIGTSYCAHPRKGGLQAAHMNDHAMVERLQKAQKQLAGSEATKRFS